jgi:hypothetical protein
MMGEADTQASSVRAPKRIPLVTLPSNRSTSYLKDSRLVNCYAEKSEQAQDYQIEKRPGNAAYPSLGFQVGGAQGMFSWTQGVFQPPILVVIAGNKVQEVSLISMPGPHLSLQTLGAITSTTLGGSGICQFCVVPAANPYLVFSAGLGMAGYYIQAGVAGVTEINDPNYPATTVPGIVYLDGTTYVMDTKSNIWGSANLNDPTVWNALNFIVANAVSDLPVMLTKQLTYVVALKSTSVQIFYDAGNAPPASPLSPVPGALLTYGCVSADTVQEIDGLLFWVTNSRTSASQVICLNNLNPQIVSTPAIDRFMDLGNAQYSTFISLSFKHAGHRFYSLTNVTANITMVFDIDQKLWYQWTDANGNYFPWIDLGSDPLGKWVYQNFQTGVPSYMDADYVYPNDSGTIVPVDIYTPNYDAGIDRIKYLSQLRFNADQTPGSTLYVRSTEDDYTTYSNFRKLNLNQKRPYLNDEGSFYRRAYHFRHFANTALRIRSVDAQIDIGTL